MKTKTSDNTGLLVYNYKIDELHVDSIDNFHVNSDNAQMTSKRCQNKVWLIE